MGLAKGSARPRSRLRHDPAPRPVEATYGPRVLNPRPGFKYKLVSKDMVEEYAFNGFQLVTFSGDEGSPKLSVGKTCLPGDVISYRDLQLMCCDEKTSLEINRTGLHGQCGLGQDYADQVERALINKTERQRDPLRGMHRSEREGLSVESETTGTNFTNLMAPEGDEGSDDEDES